MPRSTLELGILISQETSEFAPWSNNLVAGKFNISYGFCSSISDLPTVYNGQNVRNTSNLFTDANVFSDLTSIEQSYGSRGTGSVRRPPPMSAGSG